MKGNLIFAALAALCFASMAPGAILIDTPVGATASSSLPSPNFRGPSQTIDGSGLSGAVPGTISSLSQLPKHNESPQSRSDGGGMWLTDNGTGTTGWVIYDLGSVKTIDTLFIWNYAEDAFANTATPFDSSNRGSKNVNLYADN